MIRWQTSAALVALCMIVAACSGAPDAASLATAPPAQVEARGALAYGSVITDTLPGGLIHAWRFEAGPGDEVNVAFEPQGWMAWLSITGPEGAITEGRAGEPVQWVSAGGAYTIQISERYGGGPYGLVVAWLNRPTNTPTPTPTATPTNTPTPTETSTPTATLTFTPTFTATWTPSPQATATATSTPLPTSTDEPELGTGDVQVTLRWRTLADLDLHLLDPFGEQIDFQNMRSASGGTLDVDANYPCSTRTTTPVENVFWPPGESPAGEYKVQVHYHPSCGDMGPVDYEVTVKVEGVPEQRFTGRLNGPGEWVDVITFTR